MNVQFIKHNGKKQYAVIPVEAFSELLEKPEMLDDIQAYDKAMAIDDELIPSEVVDRLVSGENKIKVWREYRNMTQAELAEHCAIAQATIAQMERGHRKGSVAMLKKIAAALKLDLDDLV